jgi:hypothetical protein
MGDEDLDGAPLGADDLDGAPIGGGDDMTTAQAAQQQAAYMADWQRAMEADSGPRGAMLMAAINDRTEGLVSGRPPSTPEEAEAYAQYIQAQAHAATMALAQQQAASFGTALTTTLASDKVDLYDRGLVSGKRFNPFAAKQAALKEKQKKADEEAAKAYADFVESFKADDAEYDNFSMTTSIHRKC